MSLENLGILAADVRKLLDAIRGGEIADMKAEHEEALSAFIEKYELSLSGFDGKSKTALDDFAKKASDVIDYANNRMAQYKNTQTHIRLTKNQCLRINESTGIPLDWIMGNVIRAEKVVNVRAGIVAAERSEIEIEFLEAMGSSTHLFAGDFDIWEIELPPRSATNGAVIGLYQYVRLSQATTCAAIVKHIRGAVPTSGFCTGLKAGEPAKLCGTNYNVNGTRNGYIHTTFPILDTERPIDDTTILQIALPAIVTGHIDLSLGKWGQFPALSEKAYD